MLQLHSVDCGGIVFRGIVNQSTSRIDHNHSGAAPIYIPLTRSMKFFLHPDLLAFRKEQLDPYFARVATEKPKASRSESSEAYWVCLGYKGRPAQPDE